MRNIIVNAHGARLNMPAEQNVPFNLERFVSAQNGMYAQVCAELQKGRKQGHWMWFVFPQLKGLGSSEMAAWFGIASREEAEAYLRHPILGPRLRECTELVNQIAGRSMGEIFGYPDDLKFRSSMTLFSRIAADKSVFEAALHKYFGGQGDPLTLGLLR